MVRDLHFTEFSGSMKGIQLENQTISVLPNGNLVIGPSFVNTFVDQNNREFDCLQSDPKSSNCPFKNVSNGEESREDCDFSDAILRYISKMLMEEDMEDKTCMLQESLDLQAAEKSFYDVLGKTYPPPSPSPEHNRIYVYRNGESVAENFSENCCNSASKGNNSGKSAIQNLGARNASCLDNRPVCCISQSSNSLPNSDSPGSTLQVPDTYSERQLIWQFQKGVEEASKFLPDGNELLAKVEKKDEGEYSLGRSRGRKKLRREDANPEEEERSRKLSATYIESTLRSEMFDRVLIAGTKEHLFDMRALREALKKGMSHNMQQDTQSKGSNGGMGRGRKQNGKKEVIDLRTMLIRCAQAVAADDRRSANELLKQIRRHSSPYGDGNQRLAHCLANGLEARLAGTGSQIYRGLVNKRATAVDYLKAYRLYLAACPFRKVSNFCSNRTINNASTNAMRLHIIDFGILYGFQWPTLIQRLSARPGGPPKLRITGIEFPQPGFRPAERIEETGRRLAAYAKEFNVPFEYNAIAKKWDTIQIEELKIEKDEFLAVNCLYRAKNLHDETLAVDSPRDIVLSLTRKINPDMFIHGIVNGAFNAPFFVTRFREALFHYSAMFDMLDTVVPCDDKERMLIETEILGRESLNAVACEGWERVERPETYKQWQVRNLRAGHSQLRFDREIVEKATQRVTKNYHKDFVIAEDGHWLLLGWKGRILHALSAWKPASGA